MHSQKDYSCRVAESVEITENNTELVLAKWPDLGPLHTSVKYQIVEFKCSIPDEEALSLLGQPTGAPLVRKTSGQVIMGAMGLGNEVNADLSNGTTVYVEKALPVIESKDVMGHNDV